MQPVRVAHLLNSIGLGGVPEIVYHFLRCLPRERYALYLYCLKRHTDHLSVRERRIEQLQEIGVPPTFPDRDDKKFYVVGELIRWLIQNKIEILHTHSYKPNIYGRIAGLLCPNIKVVAHYHNYYDNKWKSDKSLIFDQRLGPFSDRLIASSEAVRDHVSDRTEVPPDRFSVILNGTDQTRFHVNHDREGVRRELGIPPERKAVGIIGRICQQKAQDDFLCAAAMVRKSVPKALFLIVGQADHPKELSKLKALAKTLGIEKDVIFTGYIDNIQQVYGALDLLIVPSRWEGFGLILVEAMASETPIVATDVGPIPEVVGREGAASLIPADAPDQIAAKAIRILNDPVLSKKMVEKGKKRVELFSWERAASKLDQLYNGLLGGDPV